MVNNKAADIISKLSFMKYFVLRAVFFLFVPLAFSNCNKHSISNTQPASGIKRVLTAAEVQALTAAGMDTMPIQLMVKAIVANEYPNIHSVLIAKNNQLVFERYFSGKDEDWGTGFGVVDHSRGTLHDLRSITKSVVSACIGIAMDKGLIQSVDQNIFDFFPEYISYKTGLRAQVTVKDLLIMAGGMQWDENISYTDPANSEIQMTFSPNPVEFVLSRPMVDTPGTVWNYNGGATQLLAGIIKSVSGKEVDAFAAENLFSALGITTFTWHQYGVTGIPAAASGLRLTPGDMIKFGLLYASKGKYNGNQILSSAWVNESFESHISRDMGGYGYQFWILPSFVSNGHTVDLVSAVGNGDQRIFFDDENHLTVVTTAGNYNQYFQKNSVALMKDFIYNAVF